MNRKLSRRQQWRAKKIQEEKTARANRKDRDLKRQMQSGTLSSEQKGLVVSRFSHEYEVEALEGSDKGQIHRCVSRANIGDIVTGDLVVWRAGDQLSGVIESRLQRQSLLQRPDNYGRLKPVAANINQMLILIAVEPFPQANLIDRYLVAAELMGIQPVLILNKIDLIDNSNALNIEELLSIYHPLGYSTIKIVCSRHRIPELSTLPDLVKNKTSIIVGQSGVGKSSLVNTLLPEAQLKVGDLSHLSGEGKHTTTQAKLFQLEHGGKLIDSPGIREFGLWHIEEKDLQNGFKEIANLTGKCRFRDCRHENEPHCAVLEAVEHKLINPKRFASFLRIRKSIAEQQARGLSQ